MHPDDPSQPFRFEGTEGLLRSFLAPLPQNSFYTYVLLKPSGEPFYIGKGTGTRVLQHRLEALRGGLAPKSNPFKCNTIRQIVRTGGEVSYRIDRVCSSESQLDCLMREEYLISQYRRRCDGGTLTNLAAGVGSIASPDPFSVERHTATLSGVSEERPERTALNLFLRALGGVDSVPVKPLSEYRNQLVRGYPSPKNLRTLSRRNGLTIAAAALASGIQLVPGVRIPRAFTYIPDQEDWPLSTPAPETVHAVIENGALSDILKLGLASLVQADRVDDEHIEMDASQISSLTSILEHETLLGWGLIEA